MYSAKASMTVHACRDNEYRLNHNLGHPAWRSYMPSQSPWTHRRQARRRHRHEQPWCNDRGGGGNRRRNERCNACTHRFTAIQYLTEITR